MQRIFASVSVIAIAMSFPISSQAEFLTSLSVETTPQPGGGTLYQYTLAVLPDSTLPSNGININVDATSTITPVGSPPSGWDVFYNLGDPSIGWGAEQFAPYLLPGSHTIFSFTSPLPPIPQDYTIFGLDDTGQIDGIITGKIDGPGIQAVPEPTSMIPLGTGLAAIGGYSLLRRGKTEEHPAGSD